MLKKGFSPAQVGTKLCLAPALIAELEVDAVNEEMPELESYDEWRRRKAQEIEKKIVAITENHLDAIAETPGELDPGRMGTVKDASTIAHKWLRNGEEGAKSLTINFSALAQVRPSTDRTEKVIELEREIDGETGEEKTD